MRALSIVATLMPLLLAGCAGTTSLAPGAPPQPAAPSPSTAVTPPTITPGTQPNEPAALPAPAPVAPPQAAAPPLSAAPPAAPLPYPSVAKAAAPAAPAPSKAPATAAQAPKAASPTADVAKPKSPPLDLTSLEQRLKSTNAIGVLTKLTLKNQVDDLLDKFRAYYQGRLKTTLADLRRSYDLLVQKVLALLQDADPPLATDIVASREPIWGILSDPKKFATI
jgi:hypothetical protein